MPTTQIKLFKAADVSALEQKVNSWLLKEGDAIQVLNMQMAMAEICRLGWSGPAQAIAIMVSYFRRE